MLTNRIDKNRDKKCQKENKDMVEIPVDMTDEAHDEYVYTSFRKYKKIWEELARR